MSINSQKLIAAIRRGGFQPVGFRVDELDGQECVGVLVSTTSEVYTLAHVVKDVVDDLDLGEPETVRTQKGLVAYWPDAELHGELSA